MPLGEDCESFERQHYPGAQSYVLRDSPRSADHLGWIKRCHKIVFCLNDVLVELIRRLV